MFLYESHLGSDLYLEKEELSLESLFCPTCGDRDWLLGEISSKQEMFNLLTELHYLDTFDDTLCRTCPHNESEDYEYCNTSCENYLHSGGYSVDYVDEIWDFYNDPETLRDVDYNTTSHVDDFDDVFKSIQF